MRLTPRMNKIISYLKNNNGASISSLSSMFSVSDMTIRRDLAYLKSINVITTVHGAAIYNKQDKVVFDSKQYDLLFEDNKYSEEKVKIGQMAASFIKPDDVVIIDTGTTSAQIVQNLPNDIPLTILCFSMNTLLSIYNKPNINVILTGGRYYRNTQMFQSREGIKLIQQIRANKAFISAAGVCKIGVTCVDPYEVDTKIAAIESSVKSILTVDSSKFNKVCPSYFSNIRNFQTIITDKNLDNEWVDYIKDLNIELFLV